MRIESVSDFAIGAQKTRVALRQITCRGGFCLLIEDDQNISQYLEKIMEKQGMRCKVWNNAKDAIDCIGVFNEEIICAIIDLNLEDKNSGKRIIDLLESEHRNIPYVVYTADRKKEATLKKQYPHINVAIKGRNNTQVLLTKLGLTV